MNTENLQQIPSNSTYAKIIKKCFSGVPGEIFIGSDFNSLESVVNALITKDPNKLRPLIEDIDSHSWNTFYYYPEQLPNINTSKDSINSIKDLYKELRQESKAITFAAQYMGTWRTFMNNSGLTEKKSKEVELNYHTLYKVSDEWMEAKLLKAETTGYVELAFGGRLRTPIIGQTLSGYRSTPQIAQAERRTAGNALGGQSYGLLNTRAANEFMERVYNSPYRLDIKIVALIHDASYYSIKDEIGIIKWVNDNLIECMQWNKLPELQHPTVKLGGELDLYPDWATPITIPNNSSMQEILNISNKYKEK